MVGTAPIANSVQAIHIDGSAQLTSTLYRGMQVTGEREKRRELCITLIISLLIPHMDLVKVCA
jgi:hypothetical protein